MNELHVQGMSCQHCSSSVTKAVEAVEGVTDVHVDLATGKVTYEGPADAAEQITANIEKAGFEVTDE